MFRSLVLVLVIGCSIGGCSTGDLGNGGDGGTQAAPCQAVTTAGFARVGTGGPTSDRPAALHADLNLALRGYQPTAAELGLLDLSGPTDPAAPRLRTLFADDREAAITAVYQVNNWDWNTNSRGGPVDDPPVTLVGLQAAPGEEVQVPASGYAIADGLQARVLFATDDAVTLGYTVDDSIAHGYALHVVGVCVDPGLVASYRALDAAGRSELPALAGNQPFARARTAEVGVAIRDTGAFMEPRSRKDWW